MKLTVIVNKEQVVIDTECSELMCVSSFKNRTVSLCFSKALHGMHLPFADIKLFHDDRWVSAVSVYDDAEKLAQEIVRRWEVAGNLEAENNQLKAEVRYLNKGLARLNKLAKVLLLTKEMLQVAKAKASELHARNEALEQEVVRLKDGSELIN